MPINYTNKNDMPIFIEDNISEINSGISAFKEAIKGKVAFDDTDIKNHLKLKINSEIPTVKKQLIEDFEQLNCKKIKIETLANQYVFYKKDLEKIIEACMFEEMRSAYSGDMLDDVVNAIMDNTTLSNDRKRFLEKTIKEITEKSLYILLQNGFLLNMNNIDSGVMTANAGDSAQFLFVSRAILAGFNCSNVDVRSSRYDAVIDYKGKIFKVQIKGVSGKMISFKDRDRGGRGIDTHNDRNQGKRITSEDCDVYAAVDKQVGLCYIIPMIDIDPWSDADIKSVNVSKLDKYRENWGIIAELYDRNN